MASIIGLLAAALFIGLEIGYYTFNRKKPGYTYNNFIANMSIGICERLIYLVMLPVFYALFDYIYQHYRIITIPQTWYFWILLLVFTDFVWYWYHRLGHQVNILWAAHIVHHQSEDFNFSVAARITIFQAYIRTLFWCVLPFAGFAPDTIMGVLVFHGSYSFFTHTELGKNLRFLEYVFITPSLHGVHHASNEKYLDKNFGDVFVFWDKLFGTFQQEEESPVYGLTDPLKSNSFLWQHFHYYLELFEQSKTKQGIGQKIRVFLSSPETMDSSIRPKLERQWLQVKYDTLTAPLKSYLTIQLALCYALLLVITWQFNQLHTLAKWEIAVFILLTLINIGAIVEQKKYIFYLEFFRIWQLILFCSILLNTPATLAISTCVVVVIISAKPIKAWYFKLVYPK